MPTTNDILITYMDLSGQIHVYDLTPAEFSSGDVKSKFPESSEVYTLPSPIVEGEDFARTLETRTLTNGFLRSITTAKGDHDWVHDKTRHQTNYIFDVFSFELLGKIITSAGWYLSKGQANPPDDVKTFYWSFAEDDGVWSVEPSETGFASKIRIPVFGTDNSPGLFQDISRTIFESSSVAGLYFYTVSRSLAAVLGTAMNSFNTNDELSMLTITTEGASELEGFLNTGWTLDAQISQYGTDLITEENSKMRLNSEPSLINPNLGLIETKFIFNNNDYLELIGNRFEEDDYTFSGEFILRLRDTQDVIMVVAPIGLQYPVPRATLDPEWDNGSHASGYVLSPTATANFYTQPQATEMSVKPVSRTLKYFDSDGIDKVVPIFPKFGDVTRTYDFSKDHVSLVGKLLYLEDVYTSLDSNVVLTSDPIVYSNDNYYDINDIELTLTGVRYDAAAGILVGYDRTLLTEFNGEIDENTISEKFFSSVDPTASGDLTINANTTDINGYDRLYIPWPNTIYLVAVPNDPSSAFRSFHERYFLSPSSRYNLNKSKDQGVSFPSVNRKLCSEIITIFNAVPVPLHPAYVSYQGTNITKRVFTHPIAPEDGTFDSTDVWISLPVSDGQWALFCIITDTIGNASMYCLTNAKQFNIP